jgi:outer membrane protein assembly factor BamA
LISDLRNVYNTDFFEHVDYRLEFTHGDSVDLIYELKERPFGFYSFGILYDNYDNVNLGFAAGQGNLAGSGANIRLALNLGNPNEIRLGLTGTRLYRASFGYRVDGFWNSVNYDYYLDRQYLTQYNIENHGLIAEAGYIIGNDAFFNFGIKGYQSTLEKPAIAFFDTIVGKPWIIGPKLKLELNNFDNLNFPTRGITYQIHAFYVTPALKASEHFFKLDYYSEQVIPLNDWFLFHPKLEIGLSWGKLSFAEYFRSGADNFQGFSKDEFTSDQKAIIGVSSDFRLFQLFDRNDYPFFLQVFAQLATFRDYNQLLNHFDFSRDYHWSIGGGIRTNTPIGPLQVSIGVADFNKPTNVSNRKLEMMVSIGREFRYREDY